MNGMKNKEKILIASAILAGAVAFVWAKKRKKNKNKDKHTHFKKSRHASPILEHMRKPQEA